MTSQTKSARIAALRRLLAAEAGTAADTPPRAAAVPLGAAEIDAALPWGGLPRGALHEIAGSAMDGAATAFAALLLARLSGGTRPVLWVAADDDLYGPGLAALGLRLDRLIVARAPRARAALWTIEEALRCKSLAAVLGETGAVPPTAGRRLQLAARGSGVAALLLRRAGDGAPLPGAMTRWRVASAHSTPDGSGDDARPRWRVALVRCRGRTHTEDGHVACWHVEWQADRLGVVPALRDRPAAPRRAAG
jgi:protein ImuA